MDELGGPMIQGCSIVLRPSHARYNDMIESMTEYASQSGEALSYPEQAFVSWWVAAAHTLNYLSPKPERYSSVYIYADYTVRALGMIN